MYQSIYAAAVIYKMRIRLWCGSLYCQPWTNFTV